MTATDTAPPEAKAAKADRSGEFVAVACKLPNGVILDLDRYAESDPQSTRPPRTIRGRLPPVHVKGWATPVGQSIVAPGGYVVTPVPKEFWDEWFERNKDGDLITSGVLFAQPTAARATAKATEQAGIKPVFAPITPTKNDGVTVAADDKGVPLLETARAIQAA